MSNVYNDVLKVRGKAFDNAEFDSSLLLGEMFAETVTSLVGAFEKAYGIPNNNDTIAKRRARILAYQRARGKTLSKAYFENIGNTLGDGVYTVEWTAGGGNPLFIVHTYSPTTSPAGPATLLPAPLYTSTGSTDSIFLITVRVTGSAGPEEDLETLYARIKPAWCKLQYEYNP